MDAMKMTAVEDEIAHREASSHDFEDMFIGTKERPPKDNADYGIIPSYGYGRFVRWLNKVRTLPSRHRSREVQDATNSFRNYCIDFSDNTWGPLASSAWTYINFAIDTNSQCSRLKELCADLLRNTHKAREGIDTEIDMLATKIGEAKKLEAELRPYKPLFSEFESRRVRDMQRIKEAFSRYKGTSWGIMVILRSYPGADSDLSYLIEGLGNTETSLDELKTTLDSVRGELVKKDDVSLQTAFDTLDEAIQSCKEVESFGRAIHYSL